MEVLIIIKKGKITMKSIRLEEEEKYIHRKNKVTLEELMKEFDVSLNTIRRDVKELLKKGKIKKVYGGVESLIGVSEEKYLNNYESRSVNNIFEKKRIAQKASEYINEGDTIFIDSGSTTVSILDNVPMDISLIVVTNSLDVINKISNYKNIQLVTPASFYKSKTRSFVEWDIGETNIIDRLNIDKCFMAATSVSKENVMNASSAEYSIKHKVMARGEKKYLLLDDSKYNTTSFLTYAKVKEFDVVITNFVPDEYLEIFEKNGVKVEIV